MRWTSCSRRPGPRRWPPKAEQPEAVPIAGGTDVMVELNFDRAARPALLDLTRVASSPTGPPTDGRLRIGAGVRTRGSSTSSAAGCPGLAMASRTVGSPQIRNRGTVGGNLGSASPPATRHPPLLAAGAEVEVESRARAAGCVAGRRVLHRASSAARWRPTS